MATTRKSASLPGVLFVIALHVALFYILWSQKLIPPPKQAIVLANIIASPKPQEEPKPEPPRSTPKPKPVFRLSSKPQPIKQPKQQQLVAKAPMFS